MQLDETWVKTVHVLWKGWKNNPVAGTVRVPLCWGEDIIVHVRTDEGFVLDSFCSVKSKKTCDIYEEKNSAKLINWFIEHIFLNLAVPSIIIMNSALYHKKK